MTSSAAWPQQAVQVGIVGTGMYLPEGTRTNDWWDPTVVASWAPRLARLCPQDTADAPDANQDTVDAILAALKELADDPFQGCRERRIAPDNMPATEMEARAARQALEAAQLSPGDIDGFLSQTLVPDAIGVNTACSVHRMLGLRPDCFTLTVQGVCNSFVMQLWMAQAFIRSGQGRYVLLTQSSTATRLNPWDEPYAPWFGDGASAVVVGPVDSDTGLLQMAFHTDGAYDCAFMAGIKGRHWWEEGRVLAYAQDRVAARRLQLAMPDEGRKLMRKVLEQAAMAPENVDFYASHQASAWLRPVTQKLFGLDKARYRDIFAWTGTLNGCNVPVQLHLASSDGSIKRGDTVAMFAAGAGASVGTALMRWSGAPAAA